VQGWVLAPEQVAPPQEGAGLVQARVWTQDDGQVLGLQALQPPLTGLLILLQ